MTSLFQSSEHEAAIRGLNARIAKSYDDSGLRSTLAHGIGPEFARGLAALYGCASDRYDVLDLGCGVGNALLQCGDYADGRLVGVDIAAASCAEARRACRAFGARATIIQADFLDLDPSSLGQFDLIYLIGTLYVVPPEVRRHLLSLVGACLRPGGVVVMTYYSGARGLLRAALSRRARMGDDPDAPIARRIAAARLRIAALERHVDMAGDSSQLARDVLRRVRDCNDAVFFHEVLDPHFEALETSDLSAALEHSGVSFINFLRLLPLAPAASPAWRAIAAFDAGFAGGGYRHAVFGKIDPADARLRPRAADVVWHSEIAPSLDASGEWPLFVVPGTDLQMRPRAPISQLALRELSAGPRGWAQLRESAARELGEEAASAGLATLEQDLMVMWQSGAIFPIRP